MRAISREIREVSDSLCEEKRLMSIDPYSNNQSLESSCSNCLLEETNNSIDETPLRISLPAAPPAGLNLLPVSLQQTKSLSYIDAIGLNGQQDPSSAARSKKKQVQKQIHSGAIDD